MHRSTRNISGLPDEVGVAALVCFAENVRTSAGEIEERPEGFFVSLGNRKPVRYATALPAVRFLRKETRKIEKKTVPSAAIAA